jgi:hypothetical protein
MMPKTGAVQLEVKKGKWSKRFLTMENGALTFSKSEKVRLLSRFRLLSLPFYSVFTPSFAYSLSSAIEQGKDSSLLCQLNNFDVFFVTTKAAEALKAPKPFVFALKSRLTRAQFIEESEWLHFLSTKTADEATGWVRSVLEAGVRPSSSLFSIIAHRCPLPQNTYARQREQAVLGATSPTTSSPSLSGPLIAPSTFAPSDAPPVPSIPSTAVGTISPAAALAASVRNNPTRPAPPMLAVRSLTAPLLGSSAPTSPVPVTLTRGNTVIKPTTREWSTLSKEDQRKWVQEGEKLAKQAKQPLLDLAGRD